MERSGFPPDIRREDDFIVLPPRWVAPASAAGTMGAAENKPGRVQQGPGTLPLHRAAFRSARPPATRLKQAFADFLQLRTVLHMSCISSGSIMQKGQGLSRGPATPRVPA